MIDVSKSDLIRMYCRDGMSVLAIGRRIGCGSSTVSRRLHEFGIPLRKPGPPSGKRNASWSGGRIVDKYGYVLLRMPDHPDADAIGYVREHRFVMEKKIGRRLEPSELVHHKNGVRHDNRAENLEILRAGEHRTRHASCPLPPRQILVDWYERDKMTMTAIAKRLGRNPSTIRCNFLKLGIPIRGSNDLRMVEMPDDLAEQYQTKSLRDIAGSVRCSVAAVADALRRLGVPLRKSRQRDEHGVLLPPQCSSNHQCSAPDGAVSP